MPRKRNPRPAPQEAPASRQRDANEWGANAVGADLSTVRFDKKLEAIFRQEAILSLHNMAGTKLGEREEALRPVLEDENFRHRWGAFLEHVGPELIVRWALEALIAAVRNAPPGTTGVRDIDDWRSYQSMELFERFEGHRLPSAEQVAALDELEELAGKHHAENPQLTYARAHAEILDTPKGAELYAKSLAKSGGEAE